MNDEAFVLSELVEDCPVILRSRFRYNRASGSHHADRKFVYHVLQHRESFRYGDKCHPVEVKLPFLHVMLYAISECVEEVETDINDFPPFAEHQTLRTLRLQLFGVHISNKNYSSPVTEIEIVELNKEIA